MKYSLDDIYNQSVNDTFALQLDGDGYESRMVYGTKIIICTLILVADTIKFM